MSPNVKQHRRTSVLTQNASQIKVMQSFRDPSKFAQSNDYVNLHSQALRDAGIAVDFWEARKPWVAFDILHVHWPELLYRGPGYRRLLHPLAFAWLLLRLAVHRHPVVQTLHNSEPHEPGRWLERKMLNALARRTTTWIVLNSFTEAPRTAPKVYIPHGLYDVDIHPSSEAPPSRAGILIFGQIRPYKGVLEFARIFRASSINQSLTILGETPDPNLRVALEELAHQDARITYWPQRVDNPILHQKIRAAALIALPYKKAENSGAAILALQLGTPLLATTNSMSIDLAREFGTSWVHLMDELNVSSMEEGISSILNDSLPPSPNMSHRSWREIGVRHKDLYAKILSDG